MSTPQIFIPGARFNVNPAQKGIMQRFIASRGRIGTPTNGNGATNGGPQAGAIKGPDSILVSDVVDAVDDESLTLLQRRGLKVDHFYLISFFFSIQF